MSSTVLGSYSFTNTPDVNGQLVLLDTGEIVLAANNSVTLPTSTNVKLFGKSLASRVFPAFVGASGMDAAIQPAVWRQKIARWNPPGNSTAVPGVDGLTTLTAVGTATARTVATTNLFSRTKRLGYVSANTTGSLCGHYNTVAQFTTGSGTGLGGFFYSCRFGFADTGAPAAPRAFVGMSSSIAVPTNVDPATLTNSIGIAQLSSSTTQLYFVHGGSNPQVTIPLGTNFPPMTAVGATNGVAYDLTMYCPPSENGTVYYRLERIGTSFVAEGVITPTTVGVQTPASSTLLTHRAWRTNNTTTGIVAVDVLGIYIETDY